MQERIKVNGSLSLSLSNPEELMSHKCSLDTNSSPVGLMARRSQHLSLAI